MDLTKYYSKMHKDAKMIYLPIRYYNVCSLVTVSTSNTIISDSRNNSIY